MSSQKDGTAGILHKLSFIVFLTILSAFLRSLFVAIFREPTHWTFVTACFILTALIVIVIEWRARMHHRNVYRDIEVRVKAIEERS